MFTSPPPRSRPLESTGHGPSPLAAPPKRTQPYLAAALVIGLLGGLPVAAVQWYAVATDSDMYSRISPALLAVVCCTIAVGTVYREGEAPERAADAGGKPPLRQQLRLVPWGRCAVAYLTAAAIAVPVIVVGAHGHQVAFPTLSAYLAALLAATFIAPLKGLFRRVPDTFAVVFTAIPMGLLIGGMNFRGPWLGDPWFWASAALGALMTLHALGVAAVARFRRRRR